jgi:hypothetical protein
MIYIVKTAVPEEKGLVTHCYTKIVTLSHAFAYFVVVRALGYMTSRMIVMSALMASERYPICMQ